MPFLEKVTGASKRSRYRFVVVTISALLIASTFLAMQQRADAVRFLNRSLYIYSSVAGATTTYTVTFTYPTINPIGSVQLLFCDEAIAYLPCNKPAGLDVSSAVLTTQTGETGFTVTSQTDNKLILSRPPVATGITESKYTFTNITNPTGTPQTFYIRLNSYTSTNATGPFVDYGSVASATTGQVGIETQVPPYLVFCTGKTIPEDCIDPKGPNFEEFEDPDAETAMATSSEMLAYTNARNGYVIAMTGRSLTSGIHEIPAITGDAEESLPGKGQFGINLTANSEPEVGALPVGPGLNTYLNPDYAITDKFLFNNGDVLVTSDGVTKRRKFTVSYVINIPPDQHPGVYNTTVTFICTANF